MLNMADSKPHPVPKPRIQQKSLPSTDRQLVGHYASILSSPPSAKPPVTRPKPTGYKSLDYNNKGLVRITAEIDIGDGPVNSDVPNSDNRQVEHNNNVANLKAHVGGGNKKDHVQHAKGLNKHGKHTQALSKCKTKPLPPLPLEDEPSNNESRNTSNLDALSNDQNEKESVSIESQHINQFPRKPPRLHSSSSEPHLESTTTSSEPFVETGSMEAQISSETPDRRKSPDQGFFSNSNPPLPRKPTKLRNRSAGTEVSKENASGLSGKNLRSSEEKDIVTTSITESTDNTKTRITPASPCRKPSKESLPLASTVQKAPSSHTSSLRETQHANNGKNAFEALPFPENSKKIYLSTSDSQINKLRKQGLPSLESKEKGTCDVNAGQTPPLPRKPPRKFSAPMEIHFDQATSKDKSGHHLHSGQTKSNLDQLVGGSHHGVIQGNQLDSRPRSTSPPGSQLGHISLKSTQHNNKPSMVAVGELNAFRGISSLHKEPMVNDQQSGDSSPNSPVREGKDKEHHFETSASTAGHCSPHRQLPELPVLPPEAKPSDNTTPLSPRRRPPPGPPPSLPKQPSAKKGRRQSEAPSPPRAPRPMSVFHDNSVQKRNFSRSSSAGNLSDASIEDPEYCVAYQHLRQLSPSPLGRTSESEEGDYESPDKNVVRGFMESVQNKSRFGQSKLRSETSSQEYEAPDENVVKGFMEAMSKKQPTKVKPDKIKFERKQSEKSATYSSSSDDSAHEYCEPDSPRPETREGERVRTVSPISSGSESNESQNYVEPIHISDDRVKEQKSTSQSPVQKFKFKPFENMGSEWSVEKEINWNYEEESDDSDASYVEPDENDDDSAFANEDDEEPLYQIYQANVFEKERTLSLKRHKKDSIPELSPTFSGNATLRSGTLRGGKMLWSQLPEVRNSDILNSLSTEQRKLQEAIYEVISSEASYLKSLNLLVDHFLRSKLFAVDSPDPILEQQQVSEVFSSIEEIIQVSQRFLDDLRSRQRQSVLVDSISDIITNHATNNFQAYVNYCSTQYKQDRTLSNLKKTNLRFADELEKIERDRRVYGLTLQSFLVLPMQRVTRYPLLVDAIIRRCEPGRSEYYRTDEALKAVNNIVYKCNEGARNEERREEMIQLQKVITFMKMKPIQLVTNDRWLMRRGPVQLMEFDTKSTLTSTLRGRFKKYRGKTIYLFLFNDLLLVTKKKSDTLYSVIDFAKRNMIRVQETKSTAKNSFMLVFLENFQEKTKELNIRMDNETDLTRWREAFEPPAAENGDEKVYSSWDCPQVQVLHNYQAQQSDELSLVPGDVVNVLRKLPDGWFEGERIRDGMCGWFPANHTEEIRNEHVRARNLHQRYRLLAASTAFLDTRKR